MAAKPKKAFKTSLLGTVANQHSNFLSVLATDGLAAEAWTGASSGGKDDDFSRAQASLSRGEQTIDVGAGRGTIAEIGGCGIASVYRVSENILVILEHYRRPDEGEGAEANLLREVAGAPTAKGARKLGSIGVSSGVLALLSLVDSAAEVSPGVVEAVAKSGKAKTGAFGLLVPITNGEYEVWREDFEPEIDGDFGTIQGRVRFVPAKTPVIVGAPIAAAISETVSETPSKAKAASPKASKIRSLLVDGWKAIASFAASKDGSRIVAGEDGGYRVCCWDSSGRKLWERTLASAANMKGFESVIVGTTRTSIFATCAYGEGLHELNPETGEVVRTHALTMKSFVLAPTGEFVAMKMGVKNTQWSKVETLVCDCASFKPMTEFKVPSNVATIAISGDGRLVAKPCYDDGGDLINVYDSRESWSARPLRLEGTSQLPNALAFSNNGILAAGFGDALVRLYDLNKPGTHFLEVDAAPDRAKKPGVTSLAYNDTGEMLAIGRDDATVKLYDVPSRKLAGSVERLEPTDALRAAIVGGLLYVNAGPKGEPVGLTVYSI